MTQVLIENIFEKIIKIKKQKIFEIKRQIYLAFLLNILYLYFTSGGCSKSVFRDM